MQFQKLLTTISVVGLAAVLAVIAPVKKSLAQYYSQGEDSVQIVVDKTVRPIEDSKFCDNISTEQKVFVENNEIEFKIVIKNSGNNDLTNLSVEDYLPKYLTLIFYPGVFNLTENKIETSIDKLGPGESKEYLIRARISDLPKSVYSNKYIQMTNKVTVAANGVSDSDKTVYYVEAITVPSTGSEDLMVKTVLIVMAVGASVGLRKIARGY